VLTRRNESILWLILITLAALVRFGPIASGLPYISYVDEGHVLHPAIEILKAKSFDSSIHTYPPLTSYLTIAAVKIYAPFYRLVHRHSLRGDLPGDDDFHTDLGDNYDLITPPEIICLGRLVVACLSVGIVLGAGAMGKLLGGSRPALMAMLFTSLCPALVSRGSIAIIDTVAAFFAVTALYFCQRLRILASSERVVWWIAALAGVAAGLAFGAKYTVGAVFAAVLITIATLPGTPKRKAILMMIATAGLCAGVFIGVPAALLHLTKIIAELRAQAVFYQSIQSDQNYWRAALSASEIGVPLVIAGLAGIIWMGRDRAARSIALSWLGFGLLLISVVAWPRFQPFRNVLSLIPLLCIAAAFFCEKAWRYLEQREIRYASQLAVAFVLFLACSFAWSSARYLATRITHTDSRVQAIDWLEQHTTKDSLVLGVRELAILPVEWKRIPAKSLVVSWVQAADALQSQRFDYVVTGNFDIRYAKDPAGWSAYRDRWRAINSTMPAAARFGAVSTPIVPYLWRTNDELIFILKPETR
jgi:dolichyl-phosphate-mannose--protein O-mannosyl transferase